MLFMSLIRKPGPTAHSFAVLFISWAPLFSSPIRRERVVVITSDNLSRPRPPAGYATGPLRRGSNIHSRASAFVVSPPLSISRSRVAAAAAGPIFSSTLALLPLLSLPLSASAQVRNSISPHDRENIYHAQLAPGIGADNEWARPDSVHDSNAERCAFY